MKKIILCIIATINLSIISYGQAIFENSYISQKGLENSFPAFKTDFGLHYYTLNRISGELLIYNANHILIKTINIPMPSGATEIQNISQFSDKLFNNDSLIEFIVSFRTTVGNPSIMTLFNENEIIIQQYGAKSDSKVINGNSNEFKLITWTEIYSPLQNPQLTYPFDVYSLPGITLNLNQNQNIENLQFFGFPNPTEKNITVINNLDIGQNGVLEVFDINGKKIIQKDVIGTAENIILDTSELSNGIYSAKLNNQTTKFIKK